MSDIDINFGALQYANPFKAYQEGQDMAARRQQRQASASAGRKLAAGDRQGAMQDLGGVGLIDDVRQLQNDQDVGQARQQREAEYKLTLLGHLAGGLKNVPLEGRQTALQHYLPVMQQAGVDVTPFAQMTPDQLSDENLAMFMGKVDEQLQVINRGGGGYDVVDLKNGGKAVRSVEPNPKLVTVGDGATLFDPTTRAPVYSNPKTFAPPRAPSRASLPPPPSGWAPVR